MIVSLIAFQPQLLEIAWANVRLLLFENLFEQSNTLPEPGNTYTFFHGKSAIQYAHSSTKMIKLTAVLHIATSPSAFANIAQALVLAVHTYPGWGLNTSSTFLRAGFPRTPRRYSWNGSHEASRQKAVKVYAVAKITLTWFFHFYRCFSLNNNC